MRKGKRLLLVGAIFLSLGGVGYKVAENMWAMKAREFKKNPLKALESLPESALQMKDFHRSKIENGRKVWEIFGEEANYYKDQKEAVIKKPRFVYYDKQGVAAETSGQLARIFLSEKELEKLQLEGGIQVSYQGYVLRSEEAIYWPEKQQIVLPSKATVAGDGIHIEGSRMEVELESQKIRLLRDIKTKLEPDKLETKNNRLGARQAKRDGG